MQPNTSHGHVVYKWEVPPDVHKIFKNEPEMFIYGFVTGQSCTNNIFLPRRSQVDIGIPHMLISTSGYYYEVTGSHMDIIMRSQRSKSSIIFVICWSIMTTSMQVICMHANKQLDNSE